jgi:hypothetical protein
MKQRLMVVGYAAIILSVALLFHGGQASTIEPAAELIDLKNLDQLKEAFQRDRGAVRLVTLLSPV